MIVTDRKVFLCRADLPESKRSKEFDKVTIYDFLSSPDFTMDEHVLKPRLILFSDGGCQKFLKKRF